MFRIALKMLFYDRAKYCGLILGVAFSILLINQQVGIFLGLLSRSGAIIDDVPEANIWVMDPGVKNLDTIFPMRDTELGRVRGVPGVAWAVPYFKAMATIRTATGELESSLLLGADDNSLIGIPSDFVMGQPEDLRRPDAVAVGKDGFGKIWRGEPLSLGKVVELNDRRAVVVAIVKDSPKFTSSITFFTRYSQAMEYTNNGRNQLSFLLVKSLPDENPEIVAQRIHDQTGLQALTSVAFRAKAVNYVVQNTGIPVSFGTVIALGVMVGVAVVGLMFNLFVLENLRHFAVLKAIGTKNSKLLAMVLLQALVVGFVGYSVGLGGAAMFFEFAGRNPNFNGFFLPWQIGLGSGVVAAFIIAIAAMVALRRVLFIEPAIVFRG
jgi:putative ABC transport system permease protein